MKAKHTIQLIVIAVMLVTSFAATGGASAWSQCPSYVTVQWGDTLSGIALLCGTSVNAIRAANPGLGWWLYAGQVLYIPTGYTPPANPTGGTYVVRQGDTIGKIATRSGVNVYDLLSVNPQISNPSLIYAGQVINLPAGVSVPPPTNYPPRPHYPPPCNCSPSPTDSLSTLKITYSHGMYIRSEPNGKIIASAVYKDILYYRTNSVFMDSNWKVWVEVRLYPPVKGHTTGWLLVKDQLGKYFTDPQIDDP